MSAFQSSMLYSFVLAVIGYLILSVVNIDSLPPAVFAAGVLIGSVFNAIISNTSTNTSTKVTTTSTNSSDNDDNGANSDNETATKTIYVGNLPYRANEIIIKELFEKFGFVHSVRLLKDRQTGKRRGFGFVEMEETAAQTAIQALNESEFQQRTLKVREAKDRPEKIENNDLQEQL
jgi:RNA recognition motif-containing protein